MSANGGVASSADFAELVCTVIGNLSGCEQNRVMLGKAGVAGQLVQLIRSPDVVPSAITAEKVSKAPCNLCGSCVFNRHLFAEAGFAVPLVR